MKTKMIRGSFYSYHRMHFMGGNASFFVIFVCNHLATSHVTAATRPGTCLWDETSRCRKSTKIIKNSNHSYVRNVLRIKLVKLQSIWKSGSSRICHTKTKSGKIWLRLHWKKNKFATALVFFELQIRHSCFEALWLCSGLHWLTALLGAL